MAIAFTGRDDIEFHAPDLLLVEVTGAIVRRANDRRLFPQEASRALGLWGRGWESGLITARRLEAWLVERAAATAPALGHPLPACIYLALAMELGCDLATADVKFRDRAIARSRSILALDC